MIGSSDRIGIVFDDDYRIASVDEFSERLKQRAGIARMESDRRLVQHIEYAGQSTSRVERRGALAAFLRR